MGQQLAQMYDEAKKLGGLKAQMRLAMISGMSSDKAKSADDSPDNLNKVKGALMEVKKEF